MIRGEPAAAVRRGCRGARNWRGDHPYPEHHRIGNHAGFSMGFFRHLLVFKGDHGYVFLSTHSHERPSSISPEIVTPLELFSEKTDE